MSTIVTDTITGKSTATTVTIGSTPVVSASANSMTIRGEGSNQTSIQQGLAKAWVRFNGQGTVAITDSYNVGSLTDSATGQYYVNFTTAMADGNYSFSSLGIGNSDSSNTFTTQYYFNGADLASSTKFPVCSKLNGSVYDNSNISVTIHGDLA